MELVIVLPPQVTCRAYDEIWWKLHWKMR